ncbi:hypothetical protein [Caballeronia sp. Lep1P3]|uniref:hypothetical protein n=1 Tax=Caballeronia sp. Lep1P3 TaxID=2878150 RepID=UPI001FD61DA6|nr:hypothetical protein [Caballeronia sp. Lep1P3]
MRQFAEAPTDGRQRVLYYVDLADEETQLERARRVFPHDGRDGGLVVKPFQSFSAAVSIRASPYVHT